MWRAQKFCCCISFQIGFAIISFVTFCLCIVHLVEFFRVQEIGVAYASGKIQNIHIIFKENLSISDFRLVECSLGSVTFGVRYVFIIFCSGGTTPLDQRYKKEHRESYSLAHGHIQFPICKNCSHIINVHGTPGFYCHYQDGGVVENRSGAKQNHSECVPKKFMVNLQGDNPGNIKSNNQYSRL
ncbi:uncharacterized protein [Drosophila suzukii]|uniref:Uncharacterized protein isoform X2 n=1 Tax=Drosophila suzukii TaxID=28584 RepID=A0ABM4TS17_DROSZ